MFKRAERAHGAPYGPTVTLREHLEEQFHHEREMRLTAAVTGKLALDLQAAEYERRLESLNHAHARTEATQIKMESTYYTREAHEQYAHAQRDAETRQREADLTWRRNIDRQLDESRGAATRQAALIALALAVFSLVLRFYT